MKKVIITCLLIILFSSIGLIADSEEWEFDTVKELIFNDFNMYYDENTLGGMSGAMSPDGKYNPKVFLVPQSQEGKYALAISYDFPKKKWCGYWSFMRNDETGYDLSEYTDFRFYVKGRQGGENFKVELKDTSGIQQTVYLKTRNGFDQGAYTNWKEAVLPLNEFSIINRASVKQVNIVFDVEPRISTVYFDYMRFTNITPLPEEPQLVIDDFNDGIMGNNLGGGTGVMSPEGKFDPTAELISVKEHVYEGNYALKVDYDFPESKWCGIWNILTSNNRYLGFKGFTDLRFFVKGTGKEKFKIELKDADDRQQSVYIQSLELFKDGLDDQWREAVIPLGEFSLIDTTALKEINIVFDTNPRKGTLYIDYIRWTAKTPYKEPDELIMDNFNDRVAGNNLGQGAGIFDANPESAFETCEESFITEDTQEGNGALKLEYNNSGFSYCGYWSKFPGKEGFDLTKTGHDKFLKFSLKGAKGGEKFRIEFHTKDAKFPFPTVQLNSCEGFKFGATNVWKEVVIPMETIENLDIKKLTEFVIVFDQLPEKGTIYIDNIRFTQ